MVEFVFIAFTLFFMMFAIIEFTRLALVYSAINNAAREGVRYAIVHGSHRTTTGDPESGPGNNPAPVISIVQSYANSGLVNTAGLSAADCSSATAAGVCVSYPEGTNETGSLVSVRVVYAYDPLTVLPLGINVRATSQGRIVF